MLAAGLPDELELSTTGSEVQRLMLLPLTTEESEASLGAKEPEAAARLGARCRGRLLCLSVCASQASLACLLAFTGEVDLTLLGEEKGSGHRHRRREVSPVRKDMEASWRFATQLQ